MIVRQLRLANFRAFEHIELVFEEDLNVIAGVNGLGKSSILQALAALFSHAIPDFTPATTRPTYFTDEDIYCDESLLDTSAIFSVEGTWLCYASLQRLAGSNDEANTWNCAWLKPDMNKSLHELLSERTLTGDLAAGTAEREQMLFALKNRPNHPHVIYFSPTRQLPGRPRTLPELKAFEVANAYSFALQDRQVDLREFMHWFRVVESGIGSSNQQGTRILTKLREVVSDFVPAFTNLRVEEMPNLRFVVEKDGVPLALNQLSDGERGLLAIIFDITRRLAIANPILDDPIADGKAIILIDEIELHLHPKWQRQVLRRFKEIFQNCQFIVTTHSPQVVGEVESRCLHFLMQEDDKVIPWTPPRSLGLDSSRVLEELMDVRARNAEIDEQLNVLSQLIDDEDFERAQQCMDKLAQTLGQDDPELTRARTLIAFLEDTE
ncbi:MAG: AAA family ATPase [Gemmatimonadota bacterium]|nr:AAA family ATPase [Gemmatimonadota bacterium]